MITLNIKPISTNQLFQGRRFKTKKYDDFIATALSLMPKREIVKGKIGMNIDFYFKTAERSDIDNLLKAILDSIVKAGYIEDDRFIWEMKIKKHKDKDERICFEVYKLN
jgi:Holliday junction resolvase RusA-like endonuclease